MKNTYLLGSLLVVLILSSCNKFDEIFDHHKDKLNSSDKAFLREASLGNNAAVQEGNLVAAKSTSPAIKAFGQQMVVEHGAAQADLKAVSISVGYPVADTLDAEHVALLKQLNSLSGRKFDSVYIHHQLKHLPEAIILFESEIGKGKNREVIDYARRWDSRWSVHLQTARLLAAKY